MDGVQLDEPAPAALAADHGFWDLYGRSFPAPEREPKAVILATLQRGAGFVLRARADGHTIGLATTHLLRHPGATFLVYLAVDPALQSRGLGLSLFEAAHELGRQRLEAEKVEPLGSVWEIDDPDLNSDERDLRLRRRRFFERAGGRVVDVPYLQPPVDGRAAVPMQLMFKPAGHQSLTPQLTAALIQAIYFEKYAAMNGIPRPILESLLLSRNSQD